MKEHSRNWHEANQRYLAAALAEVREILRWHSTPPEKKPETLTAWEGFQNALIALEEAKTNMSAPSSLDTLSRMFNLSPFEQKLLLLCAGVEMDSTFAPLCASVQADPRSDYPTFSLALAVLPERHWSALAPDGPLRYWRMVDVSPGTALTRSPLRIDERMLHFLKGWQYVDERLASLMERIPEPGSLTPSLSRLAEKLVRIWEQAVDNRIFPVAVLLGDDVASKNAVAAAAAAMVGFELYKMPADAVPLNSSEADIFLRLWEREEVLNPKGLLLDYQETDFTDTAHSGPISGLIDRTNGIFIVTARNHRQIWRRPSIVMDVQKPITDEQRAIWKNALGKAAIPLQREIEAMVVQFNLGQEEIYAASAEASGVLTASRVSLKPTDQNAKHPRLTLKRREKFRKALWKACRVQARPHLEGLAQRIDAIAEWDDLVLPDAQRRTLKDITIHARRKSIVYDAWGFAAKSARGLGISALFAGASGTGKTMAAEVLANELKLDLYRIDLSQVVSKYIGETEKNLRRVFDAAETGGAVLLFDEADALFGKRSEVKDSHDRYANIEISYLLQRMETYRGLAILTTNMKDALDAAFLRRIRFIVQFPFPDAGARADIWRRIFPENTPIENFTFGISLKYMENLAKGDRVSKVLAQRLEANGLTLSDGAVVTRVGRYGGWKIADDDKTYLIKKKEGRLNICSRHFDWKKLAQLNVVGGSIRNIAMNAAFLAADSNTAVSMIHLLQAAKMEYLKLDKSLNDAEIRGWP